MTKRVLWLDNDLPYMEPYLNVLRDNGYEVDLVATLSDAEYLLRTKKYGLLILDVMIPTVSEEEEKRYHPNLTDRGLKTGLVFYNLNKKLLEESRMHVLVMTIRLDQGIRDEFIGAGLPRDCFATKFALRNMTAFLQTVQSLI